MNKLKENRPLRYVLVTLLLVLLCFNLPNLLFVTLCLKEDIFRPPHTKVLVSACKRPIATGVPGGEVLFVREGLTDKMYLLDLRTGEKRTLPNDPLLLDRGIFLSSGFVWLEGSLVGPDNPNYRPHYILDLTSGERYELVDLKWQFPNKFFENGEINPDLLSYFTSAEKVFIYHTENRLIALAPNFRQYPERNVIFPQASFGPAHLESRNGELLEQLMKRLGVNYEIVDLSLRYTDIPSPTGKYVIRNDGIYISGADISIINREYTGGYFMGGYFKSWYYDESAVVVQENSKYLFSSTLGPRFFLIPSPLLVLRLPSP